MSHLLTKHKIIQLPISSVLREMQGNDQKRPSGDTAHKNRPKGDAGCAMNFLKGGLHAFCGKYPGSYLFPKGGRIVTQLPIRSVLRETQGDIRKMQPIKSVLRETQGAPGIS
ncbi:unnamed protein product [Prunus brigantina]